MSDKGITVEEENFPCEDCIKTTTRQNRMKRGTTTKLIFKGKTYFL